MPTSKNRRVFLLRYTMTFNYYALSYCKPMVNAMGVGRIPSSYI